MTKAEHQAKLAQFAESLLVFSAALKDDEDSWALVSMDSEGEEPDMEPDDFTAGDAVELLALEQLGLVESMSGDGSRGSCNNIPTSRDFFPNLLSNPDCHFRHFFRWVK